MRKNIWVENGSVFCDATSSCIEHPALLLDYESDLLMKYGEAEYVQGFLSRVAAANSEYAASLRAGAEYPVVHARGMRLRHQAGVGVFRVWVCSNNPGADAGRLPEKLD